MYPHASIIEKLAIELHSKYKNCEFIDIVSTSKSDIFFSLNNGSGIKFQIFQGIGFFQFIDNLQFPNKNKLQQFKSLHGVKIIAVNAHKNSRSFDFEFEDGQKLVFKLFGKFSNVILYEDEAKEIFCLNFTKDLQLPITFYMNEGKVNHVAESVNQFNGLSIVKIQDEYGLVEGFVPNSIAHYTNALEALNQFTRLFISSEAFKAQKNNKLKTIEKQIKQKEKLYNDTLLSIEKLKTRRSYSELADLLMANLHSIHKGTSNVEVLDFYNNTKLSIKIKKDLNPQQNAALLYQKSKNEIKEIQFKEKTLHELKEVCENLTKAYQELIAIEDIKALRSFEPQTKENLKNQEQTLILPYRSFNLLGFEILVGKNAKSNDTLLSKFAHKNDLWLHAKDVSGSHVLIKNPGAKVIPHLLIEQVASIAAWYSKSKNSAFVPVIYTLRKFVRKPKGSLPGQVIVEKEKTVLVKPEVNFI